jgi:Leucine-rich repeat (LRR) protein
MDDLNSETETNIASNKDINNSTTTINNILSDTLDNNNINEKELIQNLSKDELYKYKPEEITLNKKIILDSIILYNTISTNYGEKNIDITHLSKPQQEKALSEIELLLLNGKKIVHINELDNFVNLKELYLNQNFITEIKGLDNLINLQVLNLSFNNIKKIENISHLNNLRIIDLSNNLLEEFEYELIPKENIIYLYMYYNPFFKKINFFEYRSIIIINFEKIERIDKLQINDRERLLLIDKSNLKYENRLKSLEYIKKHYENYNKNSQDIFNMFKAKIDSDVEKVLNKKGEKKEKTIINNISTTFAPHNDPEDKKILKEIKDLKDQSEKFFNESILSIQNRKNQVLEKYAQKQKKLMESDTVKKLQAQIDLLNEKFKKANFIDPEIKKKFEEKIKNAIKFKERISKAEEITNKIIEDFNKKDIKHKSKSKKKQLESIPEEDNKIEDINKNEEKEEKDKDDNEFVNKINEIKLEDSDTEN